MRFELNPQLRPTTSYSMSAFSNLRSLIEDDDQFEVDECCICLYALAPFQALFVAPCSHTFHFKCIRPLLESYPGFQCPICRTYSDLEASVAIEAEEVIEKYGLKGGKCLAAAADDSGSQQQQQQRSSSSSSDPLSTTLVVSSLSQSPEGKKTQSAGWVGKVTHQIPALIKQFLRTPVRHVYLMMISPVQINHRHNRCRKMIHRAAAAAHLMPNDV